MTARHVADILSEIETLLTLHGEDEFRSRAFGRAARALETTQVDLEQAAQQGAVLGIPGIGKGLAPEVMEILQTGKSATLEGLKAQTPQGLMDILQVRGLGAKKCGHCGSSLDLPRWGSLSTLAPKTAWRGLRGSGRNRQEKILAGIQDVKKRRGKLRLDGATTLAEALLPQLRAIPTVERAEIAGRLRRGYEEIEVLSFVVQSGFPETVEHKVAGLGEISEVARRGNVIVAKFDGEIKIRIEVADADHFIATFHHRSGASDYNMMISIPLEQKGYELTENDLLRDGVSVPLASEDELFRLAGVQPIPVELREGIDEVRRAVDGTIPRLVQMEDLQGVMHVHSTWSDGQNSIQQLADHSRALGYRYLLLCDHSKAAFYANGLDEKRLMAQGKEIDEINKRFDPAEFRVLKGIECDILADGSMDLSDDALASLDGVVASIHSSFNLPPEAQTERLCRALEHRYVTMLGHPTGRLILSRTGYNPDLRQVILTAARHGKSIELNANPHRLDLSWRMIRFAVRKGVKIAINPDAHSLEGFNVLRYGITIGRKAWLRKEDVLNALSADEFLAASARMRGEGA
ncbi:MAG: Family X DNA polymerase [Chlorobi bacterium OLB7]|nr:MAG: Family X DNA polymerase [Chlorobi bacterium OLB7]